MGSSYNFDLSKKTHIFHIRVWILVTIFLGIFILLVLLLLWCCIARNKSRKNDTRPISRIPNISGEIKEIRVDQNSANHVDNDMDFFNVSEKHSEKNSDKLLVHFKNDKEKNTDGSSQSGSFNYLGKVDSALESGEKKTLAVNQSSSHPITVTSPLAGLPELSHLGWGHWFTLRDLEIATNKFSKEKVIGEGGYGIVYRGQLINGTIVAVKRLLNNL